MQRLRTGPMKLRIAAVFTTLMAVSAPATPQAPMDSAAIERAVFAVMDDFIESYRRADAKAEAATYQFPHYRLANGVMSAWDRPGAEVEAWMNATYKTLRESGYDHSAWTRRKIIHMSESKVHVDTEFTRYRKDGTVMATSDSLYILTKEGGRWGIKMRSSFDQVISAPGDTRR